MSRERRAGRSAVYAPRCAVATSQPLATTAGLSVLRRGGNAVDAAVAAAAVLNVTEPHMTGLGGDLFALVWSEADGRLYGLDASGRAGAGADAKALLSEGHQEVPARDCRAITVPGGLAGWSALLDRFGSLSLREALEPAVELARDGFPVSPIIAREWEAAAPILAGDPGAAATYLPGGAAPRAGEWFRNPQLAHSFERIGADGIETFYGGTLGAELVSGLERLGGWLTLDDLRRHEIRWVAPLSFDYHGVTVHEIPPAGQGIAALQMLGIIEGIDLGSMGHNAPEYLHALIEAKKLAYADLERYVGDPDHMRLTPETLLEPGYLSSRRGLIEAHSAADRPDPGPAATRSDTVYLTTSDAQGNMVSLIHSIYMAFGSGIVVPGTGFALQNRGAGFTLEAGHPNRLEPGKRPLHTIIPAFVTREGRPWISYGVMGGAMQPQGHVQVLLNMLHFGMDVQEAIDAPRFRHLEGRRVAVEALSPSVTRGLEARGHELVDPSQWSFGGAQAIIRLERGWAAGSDPRKDGMAAGH